MTDRIDGRIRDLESALRSAQADIVRVLGERDEARAEVERLTNERDEAQRGRAAWKEACCKTESEREAIGEQADRDWAELTRLRTENQQLRAALGCALARWVPTLPGDQQQWDALNELLGEARES